MDFALYLRRFDTNTKIFSLKLVISVPLSSPIDLIFLFVEIFSLFYVRCFAPPLWFTALRAGSVIYCAAHRVCDPVVISSVRPVFDIEVRSCFALPSILLPRRDLVPLISSFLGDSFHDRSLLEYSCDSFFVTLVLPHHSFLHHTIIRLTVLVPRTVRHIIVWFSHSFPRNTTWLRSSATPYYSSTSLILSRTSTIFARILRFSFLKPSYYPSFTGFRSSNLFIRVHFHDFKVQWAV